MKITVVGMGYVGLSNAVMLSQNNEVSVLEIDANKVTLLNDRKSPIQDDLISSYLQEKSLKISATTDSNLAFAASSFIIICTPTNFIESKNSFCTSSIDEVADNINRIGFNGLVVIRSTVPIGYTQKLQAKYPELSIAFFPEFLREGSALMDSLNPSRIICGSSAKLARDFIQLLLDASTSKDVPTLLTEPDEAEAIKLFSNAYLAMRVAFFNELDTFAYTKELNAKDIINGVSMDSRIGNFYNNPSFGYGGYCLPKDSKQLEANFALIPQELITASIKSNAKRKKFISKIINDYDLKNIGIYKLAMKLGSDNWRESALIDLIIEIKKLKKQIYIFDPILNHTSYMDCIVIKDLDEFIDKSDLIVANRIEKDIEEIDKPVFTRDIFNKN
ncbi:nucleotide sugar dehydrogenase [Gammaproteobacteria bacterium]|jgi:UDPglucose 6-dehydrogenase|nr:nucleotide sugar dehydrogenase [Gammaproteobacteria bacterium]